MPLAKVLKDKLEAKKLGIKTDVGTGKYTNGFESGSGSDLKTTNQYIHKPKPIIKPSQEKYVDDSGTGKYISGSAEKAAQVGAKYPASISDDIINILKSEQKNETSTTLKKPTYSAAEVEELLKPKYTEKETPDLEKPIYTATDTEIEGLTKPTYTDHGGSDLTRPKYSGTYAEQIQQILNDVLTRNGLDYDQTTDPFYNTAKQQQIASGKQAMDDTMGQASSLTGGYASSYAQAAGQQQYNNYLTQLANMAPEFYNMALDKYNGDTNALTNKLGILQNAENEEYGKYRDTVGDYYNDVSQSNAEKEFYYNEYRNEMSDYYNDKAQNNYEKEFEYGKYKDTLNDYYNQLSLKENEKNSDYNQYRDSVNDYYNDKTLESNKESSEYGRYRDKVNDYNNDRSQANYEDNRDYERYMSLINTATNANGNIDNDNTFNSEYYKTLKSYVSENGLDDTALDYLYNLYNRGKITESQSQEISDALSVLGKKPNIAAPKPETIPMSQFTAQIENGKKNNKKFDVSDYIKNSYLKGLITKNDALNLAKQYNLGDILVYSIDHER